MMQGRRKIPPKGGEKKTESLNIISYYSPSSPKNKPPGSGSKSMQRLLLYLIFIKKTGDPGNLIPGTAGSRKLLTFKYYKKLKSIIGLVTHIRDPGLGGIGNIQLKIVGAIVGIVTKTVDHITGIFVITH